jgi:hypothetical protein
MSKGISPIDTERFRHINELMDGLHAHLSKLYESLADREIAEAKTNITAMIKELRDIQNTM